MKTSVCDWQDVNIEDIAALTYDVLQHSARRADRTVERVATWLRNLTFDKPFTGTPAVIQAHEGEKVIGWLMLCTIGKTAEVVPWSLGIRPIVAPGYDRVEVIAQLFEEGKTWAKKAGVETVVQRVDKEPGHEFELGKDVPVYESLGFHVQEDTLYMDYYIAGDEESITCEGVELYHVTEVDKDELYHCYYDTFKAGQSPFFFDQNKKERRDFFDLLFTSGCEDEDCSFVMVKDKTPVGFSFVRPYGDSNMLLEWIGVHPAYRRQGLGEGLLRHIMKRVSERDYRTMSLSCAVGNTRAFSLYRKCGWEVEGGETILSLKI